MSATMTMDQGQVRRMLDRVATATGQTTRALLVDVMRLWGNDLVRMTYPRTPKEGRTRVAQDIGKLFMDPTKFEKEGLRDVFDRGKDVNVGGPNYMLQFRPKMRATDMAEIHESKRGRKGGIKKQRAVMVVKGSQIRKLIRIKQAHVGRLKSGWLAVVERLAGNAPAWVKRHGARESDYQDTLNERTLQGALTAINMVPYAEDKIDASFMALLERKRVSDLTKGYYAKRWQKETERKAKTAGAAL